MMNRLVAFVAALGLLASGALADAAKRPGCICPRIFDPVCGSDGRTYNNECLLDCQKARDPMLTKVSDDACKGKVPDKCCTAALPDCRCGSCFDLPANVIVDCGPDAPKTCCKDDTPCSKEFEPVCGKDGQDYSNECLAENAGTTVDCKGGCPCRRKPDKCCSAAAPDCRCGTCQKVPPFTIVSCAPGFDGKSCCKGEGACGST